MTVNPKRDKILIPNKMEDQYIGYNMENLITINHYDGIIPFEKVKARMLLIIKANMWLTSRLEKRQIEKKHEKGKITKTNKIVFVYNNEESSININDYVFEKQMDYDLETPYNAIGKNIDKYVNYYTGAKFMKKPLMQVCISTNKEKNTSCMLFSMSHILVDGYSYYKVMKMLDET